MGIVPSSRKSTDLNNNDGENDLYDTRWLEAVDKSFVFVWCDASIGTQTNVEDSNNTLRNIASVVNKNRQLVHTFNEVNACREFITHVNNVCLIISGSFGEALVPEIHNLEQIHSIYIFCVHKAKHEPWSKYYRKVRGVCTKIGEICESLKSNGMLRAVVDHDRIEFDVCSHEMRLPTSQETDICLTYSILTRSLLSDMTDHGGGQQDMITYCRSEYTSESQIQLINDFENNYVKFNPVWWYTKNHFFQGIVNRALRVRDLYAVFSMQPFIKDLKLALSLLHKNTRVSNEPLNLYFGQVLTPAELERLQSSQGQLMCINQFVSANSEKAVALMFIKQQNPTTAKQSKLSVLFQIRIDQSTEPNVPYADIGSVSQFVHEREHLVSMFSVFRIGRVEPVFDMPSTWLVSLILVGKNDLPSMPLRQFIRQESVEDDNYGEVGYTVKDRLSHFKSTHKLFKRALENNRQELRAIMLHYNMAIIYDALGSYDKSLDEYRGVITMARSSIPSCQQNDDLCLTPVYSNMGLTFQQNNRFINAFEHGSRALRIVSKAQTKSASEKELESACYVNFGTIHAREGKAADARKFYETALHIRQEYLPLGHSDITVLQRLITLSSSTPSD